MEISQIALKTNNLYNATNKLLAKYDGNLHNPSFGYGNPFLDDSEAIDHCFKSFLHSVNNLLKSNDEPLDSTVNSLYYLQDLTIDLKAKFKKEKAQTDSDIDIHLKREEGIKILKRWYKNLSNFANQLTYLLGIKNFNTNQITKNLQRRAKFLGLKKAA